MSFGAHIRSVIAGLLLWVSLCAPTFAQQNRHEAAYLDQLDYASYLNKFSHVVPSPYSFLAGGHWYGAHENHRSQHPSASLFAAIPAINRLAADEILALGDVVRDASDTVQVYAYLNLDTRARKMLLPGNHDLLPDQSVPILLQDRVPFQHFHGDHFLLLNTESLRFGGGKAMLAQIADTHVRVPEGRNLMVFSHRLLWALAEPGFAEMDDFANEPFAPLVSADTIQLIYQAVLNAAQGGQLHWFSGDIGASWSENVFYGASADSSRHFYAAGLGDCPDDAFWHVQVDSLGHVDARVWMLNGSQPKPLKHYGLDGWRTRMQARTETGNGWLSALKSNLKKRWFWAAFGLGGILALVIGWIWRRMRRR